MNGQINTQACLHHRLVLHPRVRGRPPVLAPPRPRQPRPLAAAAGGAGGGLAEDGGGAEPGPGQRVQHLVRRNHVSTHNTLYMATLCNFYTLETRSTNSFGAKAIY